MDEPWRPVGADRRRVALDPAKPLIICEGPTVPVYIKCAIRKLATAIRSLASTKDGKFALNVNFFKYLNQSRDLLQMRGSAPDLKFFLQSWKEKLAKYEHRPMEHPVIVLINKDDGATEIFKMLQARKNLVSPSDLRQTNHFITSVAISIS